MKQFYSLILTCILISILSCKRSDKQDANGITLLSVNTESVQDKVCMSEIAKSAKCVPLVTSNDLLINDIVKVVHVGTNIYIADRMNLYKFDENGLALGEISKSGLGPGEYISISDFVVNEDGTVWVLCRSSKQLINYDWNSIEIENIPLNNWVNNIYKIDNDRLCLYLGNEIGGENHSQLKVLNIRTKKIESESLGIDLKKSKYLHVKSTNHFNSSNSTGNIYFFELFNDTIYKLSDNKVTPYYNFLIGNKNIPTSFFDTEYKDIMDFFQTLFKNNYAYGVNIFMESIDQYVFSYYYKGECHMAIIPKDDSHSPKNFKIIEDDVNFYKYPINLTDLNLFIQNNNELIIALTPTDIITYATKNLGIEKVEEVKKILKYTNEDQNPILIFMEM